MADLATLQIRIQSLEAQVAKQRLDHLTTSGTKTDTMAERLAKKFLGLNAAQAKTAAAVGATVGKLGALGVAFGSVVSIVRAGIAAYAEQEKAEARLTAVLRSTGGAAGLSATELGRMASALQSITGVADETITQGQAVLATFTRVGRDVFPAAVEAALNMSAVMGQNLQTSIVQIGRALNEPIEGVGALRRVGVQLTDQQEAMIRTLMESNDVLGAQKIILGELTTQFGGAAVAVGGTMAGSLDKMNAAMGELYEVIGRVMLTGLQPLLTMVTELAGGFAAWTTEVLGLSDAWRAYNQGSATLEQNIQVQESAIRSANEAIAEYRRRIALIGTDVRGRAGVERMNEQIQEQEAVIRRANRQLESLRRLQADVTAGRYDPRTGRAPAPAAPAPRAPAAPAAPAVDFGVRRDVDLGALLDDMALRQMQDLQTATAAEVLLRAELYDLYQRTWVEAARASQVVIEESDNRIEASTNAIEAMEAEAEAARQWEAAYQGSYERVRDTMLSFYDSWVSAQRQATDAIIRSIEREHEARFRAADDQLNYRKKLGFDMAEEEASLAAQRIAAEQEVEQQKAKIQAKQFEREKQASIARIMISQAEAVARALTLGPAAALLIPVIVATTLAQIALVASQRYPGLALGGTVTAAGRALVGEAGPEVVDLPRGARVTPLRDAQAEPRVVIYFSGDVYGAGGRDEFIRQVADGIRRQRRSRTLTDV